VDHSEARQLILAVLVFTSCLMAVACGSRESTMHRVGILYTKGEFIQIVDGFKEYMNDHGYLEGKNITYHMREWESGLDEMQRLADGLTAEGVDVLFAVSTPLSLAAKKAGLKTGIPVVFAYGAIEETQLVKSVSEPGKNITGVRYPGPETISKRLELLMEIAPRTKRVWVCYDQNNPNIHLALKALRDTASVMHVSLVEVPALALQEVKDDLARRLRMTDPGMDAIILMPDGFNHSPAGLEIIGGFARKRSIPLGGSFAYTEKAGAIFGNANNLTEVGKLAAPLVDKVLKGVPAGTIPVLTPVQQFWINPLAAERLGLTVPDGLLKMAEIIVH
jgi:putative ABC transport system substrate-binding protein